MMPLPYFFFGPFTEEEQDCGVVVVFITNVNSTSVPCMNVPDYPFLYFLETVAAYLTFAYIGGKQGFSITVHLFFFLLDKLWRNSQT